MAQETGKLLRWLKAEGDMVNAGDIIMEIETDKAIVEIEAAQPGTLAGIIASEGQVVPVGQAVAFILADGEKLEHAEVESTPKPAAAPESTPAPRGAAPVSPVAARLAAEHGIDTGSIQAAGTRIEREDVLKHIELQTRVPEHVLASPKARRLAKELKIELAEVTGSGPQGAVLADDLLQLEKTTSPSAISSTWQLMAERVTQAWTQVPHFYLFRQARADGLISWKERVQQRAAPNVTYTDLLVKIVAESLLEHPNVNARWEGETIRQLTEINIGIAAAVKDGLVVPVIHGAADLSLDAIAERRSLLVERAQEGRLRLPDLQGGSFTISNLGMFEVDAFTAILNSPQAAILAVGRIAQRVVAQNGRPVVAPTIQLSLAFDHRVVDGVRGAGFMQTLVGLIEEPLALLE